MLVEIVHIDDCANWQEAARRVRIALDDASIPDASVTTRVVRTPAEALESGFAGSPTVLIDGVDAFPSDGRTTDLACRVYPVPSGLAPYPTVDQLVTVFREHAAR